MSVTTGGGTGDATATPHGCLTLTTDYGCLGGFVGVLHAVAFRMAPAVRVIDLDHFVPPHDVRLGALRLERFMRFAPSGVHVGVVDPGVGGERRAVAITAGAHGFVGPDNGLLPWAAEAAGGELCAVVLDRPEWWLATRSRTFDGRDVFVPVAAHLLRGVGLGALGTAIDPATLERPERPVASVTGGTALLEVLQVDGFGNVQLSGDASTARELGLEPGDPVRLATPEGVVVQATYVQTFGEVARGETALLLDSDGSLALSVNCGRADGLLGHPRATGGTQAAEALTLERS